MLFVASTINCNAEGAELMLPRKIPMRVEPKSYFGEQLLGRLQRPCRWCCC
jgi:hypothetical protein